jgi:type III secretion protein S
MLDLFLVQSFVIVVLISGIPLVASSFCALLVSIIQAATQIQEQTVTYLVRFSALSATIALCSSWFISEFISYFQEALTGMIFFGRL